MCLFKTNIAPHNKRDNVIVANVIKAEETWNTWLIISLLVSRLYSNHVRTKFHIWLILREDRNNSEYFNTILMYKKGRNIKAKEKCELSTRAVGGFYFTAHPITQVFVFLSFPSYLSASKLRQSPNFFPIRCVHAKSKKWSRLKEALSCEPKKNLAKKSRLLWDSFIILYKRSVLLNTFFTTRVIVSSSLI